MAFLTLALGGTATAASPPMRSPEELVAYGFAHSRVVMMNEAHNGDLRCVRTRQIGRRILATAHTAGVRHLAMEALFPEFAAEANRTRHVPVAMGGYLAQPEMRALIQAALDLEWTLVCYEAQSGDAPGEPGGDPMGLADTNWRELAQAHNLDRVVRGLGPAGRLLVWCGNSHLRKSPLDDWIPMGFQFHRITGLEAFAIDQTITVDFPGSGEFGARLVARFREMLKPLGGTAGYRKGEVAELDLDFGVDALLLSIDNSIQ